jgi:glycosyltransferase involved in cell wall biosynthesis
VAYWADFHELLRRYTVARNSPAEHWLAIHGDDGSTSSEQGDAKCDATVKVLVFPHHLEIGGSQVNAIDLAAAVRDRHGHDVVFFATTGPARELVEARGLRLLTAPRPRTHPSLSMTRALRRAIRAEKPDVVHAWDWPQAVDALFGVGMSGVPLLCSEMSMSVLDIVPRHIPLTLGTEELVAGARARRGGLTELLEPPVDTEQNRPDVVDPTEFRAQFELDDGALTVVIVSRLVGWLKEEGIRRAITAVADISDATPIRLVVVGDGTAEPALRAHAEAENKRVGRRAAVLTGALIDPRPAYAAADIVVGMGGSALRGMAFGKPLIVVGEQGFSEIFEPGSASQFFWQGYYGHGSGDSDARLESQIRDLAGDPERRAALAAYSLEIVEKRYALEPMADKLDDLYRLTVEQPASKATVLKEATRIATRRTLGAAKRAVARKRSSV